MKKRDFDSGGLAHASTLSRRISLTNDGADANLAGRDTNIVLTLTI